MKEMLLRIYKLACWVDVQNISKYSGPPANNN